MRQQPVVVSFVFISIDDQSRLPFMSCHACLSRLFFHLLLLSVPLYLVHSNPVGTSAVVLLFVRHLAPQIKDGGGLALLLLWPVCSLFWFLAATEMSPIVFAAVVVACLFSFLVSGRNRDVTNRVCHCYLIPGIVFSF